MHIYPKNSVKTHQIIILRFLFILKDWVFLDSEGESLSILAVFIFINGRYLFEGKLIEKGDTPPLPSYFFGHF